MSFKPETATEKLFRHLKNNGSIGSVIDALKCGADPNGKSAEGSVLIVAARHADVSVLKTVVAAGAKLEERDSVGDTALMAAVRHAQHKNIQYLLEQGANIRAENSKGETAADIAERYRDSTYDSMERNAMDGNQRDIDRALFQTWQHIAQVLRDRHDNSSPVKLQKDISVRKPLRFKPRM